MSVAGRSGRRSAGSKACPRKVVGMAPDVINHREPIHPLRPLDDLGTKRMGGHPPSRNRTVGESENGSSCDSD